MARPIDGRTLQSDTALRADTGRIALAFEQRAVLVDVQVSYPDSSTVVAATTSWRPYLRDGSVIDLSPRGVPVRRTAKLLEPTRAWHHGDAVQRSACSCSGIHSSALIKHGYAHPPRTLGAQ